MGLIGGRGRATRRHPGPPRLQSPPMKTINAIMIAIGWIFAITAVLAALGFGSVHLHFGPFDFRLPARFG